MLRKMIAVAAFALAVAPVCATAATLDNLRLAFASETDDHASYLAFAEKADQEGYPSVATLFRAAARAEEIHANNHAEVLKALGVEIGAIVPTAKPAVKSTKENLAWALDREIYERDSMYPDFLRLARQENAGSAAIRTLNYAQSAEASHAELFAKALHDLGRSKGVLGTYYVCTICGYTTSNLAFEECPSCADPKHDYEPVH